MTTWVTFNLRNREFSKEFENLVITAIAVHLIRKMRFGKQQRNKVIFNTVSTSLSMVKISYQFNLKEIVVKVRIEAILSNKKA